MLHRTGSAPNSQKHRLDHLQRHMPLSRARFCLPTGQTSVSRQHRASHPRCRPSGLRYFFQPWHRASPFREGRLSASLKIHVKSCECPNQPLSYWVAFAGGHPLACKIPFLCTCASTVDRCRQLVSRTPRRVEWRVTVTLMQRGLSLS